MKKIGILTPSSEAGGVFQHAQTITESLMSYSANQFECHVFRYDTSRHLSLSEKIINFLNLILGGQFHFDRNFNSAVKSKKIDLLIFPTPFSFAVPYKTAYIVFIPDLMYRYYPNFPDYPVSLRIKRDVVYKYFAKNSIFNVVDSKQGADDLVKFFKIKKDKIRIIPHIPAGYIYKYKNIDLETAETVLANYKLPEQFLFYPAQFWAHKNHQRLAETLFLLKNRYKFKIPLVLVGSSSERSQKTYENFMRLIKKLKIEDQIFHLGFVSNEEIVALYKRATALIFPTLIGPTSIPPLEAMVLGTPVLCSNLFEMPKQVEEAGLLFNPFEVEDMAEKIRKIWTDKNLRQELISKGYDRTKNLNLESCGKQWKRVIEEALSL